MSQFPAPAAGDPEVEPIVVVGRTIGGLALIVVGLVLALGGAFVFIVPAFVAPFAGGIWDTLWDLDIVGAIVGGVGLVLAVVGGGLVQRARTRKLEMFLDPAQVADALRDADDPPAEIRTGEQPRTIL